jgi:hypothetical protein
MGTPYSSLSSFPPSSTLASSSSWRRSSSFPSRDTRHEHNNTNSHTKRLSCKYHPNSSSHATADCYVYKREQEEKAKSSSSSKHSHNVKDTSRPSSAVRRPTMNLENVLCFKCNKKGHYANQCPESHRSTNNGSSSRSPSTAPSSSSSSLSNNDRRIVNVVRRVLQDMDIVPKTSSSNNTL